MEIALQCCLIYPKPESAESLSKCLNLFGRRKWFLSSTQRTQRTHRPTLTSVSGFFVMGANKTRLRMRLFDYDTTQNPLPLKFCLSLFSVSAARTSARTCRVHC